MLRVVEGGLFDFVDMNDCKIFLDIGATKGDFAELIQKFSPKKCVSVEASPVNHRKLTECLTLLNQTIGEEIYFPVLKALTSKSNGEFINCMSDMYWSEGCCYTVEEKATDQIKQAGLIVETISLPKIFEDFSLTHVDFMKMDIEGSEFNILKDEDCFEKIKLIDSFAIEFHLHYLREVLGLNPTDAVNSLLDIVKNLEAAGYTVILSAPRDVNGRKSENFELNENTYCIDMWATRKLKND